MMFDDFSIGSIILLVVWLVGGNFLISEFFRRRKCQILDSLSPSTILLSEIGVTVKRSSFASMALMKGDVYLTPGDMVIIRYYPIPPFLKLATMYQPHYQIVLREGLAHRRTGTTAFVVPVESIGIRQGNLCVQTRRGLAKTSLYISVHEPEKWLEAIQQYPPTSSVEAGA